MRVAAIVGAVIIALGLAVVLRRSRTDTRTADADARGPSAGGPAPAAAGTEALRQKVLNRELLPTADTASDGIRAVVFDWGLDNGTATLVAYEDGTTSLYFSGGGGILGAGAHDVVKRAALAFREEAGRTRAHFTPADTFPYPERGTSVFYLVTDSATLTSGGIPTANLEREQPPFGELGRRAQQVITEIRNSTPR